MAKGKFYFPFMYQRFYSSTRGWTEEQEGAYLRLLTYQFENGFIPNDMKLIKRISPKAVKNWSLFRSKFDQNSDGNFINSVMDEIRKKFINRKETNKVNGNFGGRPKTEMVIENKTETGHIPNPYPNNSTTVERVLQSEEPAHDLKNSNLFRKPVIPTKHQVLEAILNVGGTKEMAKKFYEKHEGTGWFINGSPIVNFAALANKFVSNWKKNEKNNLPGDSISGPPLSILQ